MESWLIVRVQLAKSPNDIVAAVQKDLLVAVVS